MTNLLLAEEKAKTLRDDLLRTAPLAEGLGIVAYYASDVGLRSFGQMSLVQGNGPGYGLVISADGSIPRDAAASELLNKHNKASKAPA